jgi:acetyltransferase-like isoleucine patch superfamily enzyme
MKPALALAFDAAFLVLAVLVVGPPLALVSALVAALPLPGWLAWGLGPVWYVLFVVGLVATAGLVRLLFPRLVPGTYPFPGSAQATGWLLHFALQRLLNQPLWQPAIFCFAGLRWAMLRALGAKAAFGIQTAMDVKLVDPSLFEVGPGSMLAAGTMAAGHFIENGQIMLAPVRVAAGVQVMGQVMLSPGARIGENTVLGPGTKLLPHVEVGEDVFVGMGCLLYDEVKIGGNAVIGHQATLERGVVVGEGAVVRPFARVPRGTVIPDGGKFPPGKEG